MSAVEAVVAAGGVEARNVMDRVEERMRDLATSHGALLARYAGETIAAGGKRLRPLLVCLSAGVPVPETDGLVRSAVAVELIHAATLVHDDVLDGSALRRGPPHGRGLGWSPRRNGDRRPAVLTRVRGARRHAVGRCGAEACPRDLGARRR